MLSAVELAAAVCIGYVGHYAGPQWDAGIVSATCNKPWGELFDGEADAALVLGYTEADWDHELAQTKQ